MKSMPSQDQRLILIFDGVCNLCNQSVQSLIKLDKQERFHFASLQSDFGLALLAERPELQQVDSVILLEGNIHYQKSDAILRILYHLGGWKRGLYFFRLIHRPLRDRLYDWIARHRYRWFGKRETCMVPTQELRQRFLD